MNLPTAEYQAIMKGQEQSLLRIADARRNRDISRPFPKPASGRIAVKVINHLGDEVMKVFKVE